MGLLTGGWATGVPGCRAVADRGIPGVGRRCSKAPEAPPVPGNCQERLVPGRPQEELK